MSKYISRQCNWYSSDISFAILTFRGSSTDVAKDLAATLTPTDADILPSLIAKNIVVGAVVNYGTIIIIYQQNHTSFCS
jgi:hypothetical protein